MHFPESLESMRSTLPASVRDKVVMAQINGTVCARSLVTGRIAVHDKDGTRVAWTEEPRAVFLTCVKGGHKIDGEAHRCGGCKVVNALCEEEHGSIVPLRQVHSRWIHWAMLSEEELKSLVKQGAIMGCLH